MKTLPQIAVLVAVLLFFAIGDAFAAAPAMINYQGRLTGSSGEPLDTTVSMEFAIYDDSTGGVSKWTELHSAVTVQEGTFNVLLGSVAPVDDSVFNHPNRWLGISVGGDPELSPRTRLVSVGYSHRVATVDGASGGHVTGDLMLEGNLGIGTTTPTSPLEVSGQAKTEALVIESGGTTTEMEITNSAAAVEGFVKTGNTGGLDRMQLGTQSSHDLALAAGNATEVTIKQGSGNVGIGTISPTVKLHVMGNIRSEGTGGLANFTLTSTDPSGHQYEWYLDSPSPGQLSLYDRTAGSTRMTYSADGYVHVGFSNGTAAEGGLITYSGSDNALTTLSRQSSYPEYGYIAVFGDNIEKAALKTNGYGQGELHIGRDDGLADAVRIRSVVGAGGYITCYDYFGAAKAGMYVDNADVGYVYANQIVGDVKNFKADNPNDPATDIWYACPEGPEAAAYVRGTASLENGSAIIRLPEHFTSVAAAQGMTVQLTPHSTESMGLAAVERSAERIVVRELAKGQGNYEFDFYVMAIRKGYENYEVVRPKQNLGPPDINAEDAPAMSGALKK